MEDIILNNESLFNLLITFIFMALLAFIFYRIAKKSGVGRDIVKDTYLLTSTIKGNIKELETDVLKKAEREIIRRDLWKLERNSKKAKAVLEVHLMNIGQSRDITSAINLLNSISSSCDKFAEAYNKEDEGKRDSAIAEMGKIIDRVAVILSTILDDRKEKKLREI